MKINLTAVVLFDIINNTKNPKLAMSLIDGTYTEPELPKSATIGKEQTVVSFESYDKWTDTVVYRLPDGQLDSITRDLWNRYSNVEEMSFVAPKDIKIMEAMASQTSEE